MDTCTSGHRIKERRMESKSAPPMTTMDMACSNRHSHLKWRLCPYCGVKGCLGMERPSAFFLVARVQTIQRRGRGLVSILPWIGTKSSHCRAPGSPTATGTATTAGRAVCVQLVVAGLVTKIFEASDMVVGDWLVGGRGVLIGGQVLKKPSRFL